MPEPQTGETQKEFIGRCIPFVKKEHPDWEQDQIVAVCYSIWRRSKGIKDNTIDAKGYFIGTCEIPMKFIATNLKPNDIPNENKMPENKSQWISKRMIAMRGDTFLDGGFFSNEEAARVEQYWNGTLHDIDHKGWGKLGTDITYFIGYHKNANYNQALKQLEVDLEINTNAEKYKSWQAFIDICENAGRNPNVSVSYLAMVKYVNASKLPKDVDYKKYGFREDSMVPYLVNVIPIAISTVMIGRCDGCSLNSCEDGSCKTNPNKDETENQPDDNAKQAEEKKALIEQLQKEDLIEELTKEES